MNIEIHNIEEAETPHSLAALERIITLNEAVTDPMEELKAMTTVAGALVNLDAEATGRVIRWAAERFGKSGVARSGRNA